jgi:hypothetical protein
MSSGDENPLLVGRAGPVFDNAWRLLFEGRAEAVAAFVTGQPIESFVGARFLPTDLAGTTLSVDALIEVGGRRLHVELQLLADAVRFEPRLVNYWARLNALSKVPFEQHVIVMNPRGGRLSGSYRRGRLQLEYFVHHLWDVPVENFLTHETLFPFAVLGRAGSRAERGSVLQTVIGKAESAIDSDADGADRYTADDAVRTIEIAATLASIYLKRSTIREILERNNNMTVLLRDFPLSQSFIEEGRLEGRQEGMEALLTLARARHGELSAPLIDALASSQLRLTELTEIVLTASNQSELERLIET